MINTHLKAGLLAVACSMVLTACAKDLPELPVYAPATTPLPAPLPTQDLVAPSNIATNPDQALAYVAHDLAAGLSYISGKSPNLISLNSQHSDTEFDALVEEAMLNMGYSIDNSAHRSGSERLATSVLQKRLSDNSYEITGIISLNSVLVKRSYSVQGSTVTPRTSYFIRGINPQLVRKSAEVRVI